MNETIQRTRNLLNLYLDQVASSKTAPKDKKFNLLAMHTLLTTLEKELHLENIKPPFKGL